MKTRFKGFSIIEVVLVLGIAGVIFMMAFIALPSLWVSQRDAARKAKVMEFVNDLKTYQTNNSRGALPVRASGDTYEVHKWSDIQSGAYSPNDWAGFIKDYVAKDFEDSGGFPYTFYITRCKEQSREASVDSPCSYGPAGGATNEKGEAINGFAAVNANVDNKLDYTIYAVVGAVCKGDQAVRSPNDRDVAVIQVLEHAGRYCYNT